jgi:hypothetical protein
MARRNHRFLKNGRDLFLPGHLDSRITVELLRKIRFYAHVIFRTKRAIREAVTEKIDQILPVGRIGKSVRSP